MEDEVYKYRSLETTVAVILSVYMIVGLTGNLLTIIALLRCPRVRNVTAAFITSLCVADCLFCVLVLPWEVSRFFAGEWVWGQGVICTVLPLIRYWNVAVSLLSIAMITINRYIMIAHFSIYKTVYKKGWIALMIAFCWLFPFAMLFPTLIGKWGRFGMIEALETCSIVDEGGQSPKKVLFGMGFCVPAVIIIICYSLIFYVIHRSEERLRKHTSQGVNGTQNKGAMLQNKTHGKSEKEERRKRNEWRITKMVMIIFIAFLVTYMPITLIKFIDPEANYQVLHLLGYVMIYLSCCVNPIIYVIMNRQYRQAYKTVLMCRRPRLHSFSSHGDQREMQQEVPPALRYISSSIKGISQYGRRSFIAHENKAFCMDSDLCGSLENSKNKTNQALSVVKVEDPLHGDSTLSAAKLHDSSDDLHDRGSSHEDDASSRTSERSSDADKEKRQKMDKAAHRTQTDLNDKTLMSQLSETDPGNLPDCHELPEVFPKK